MKFESVLPRWAAEPAAFVADRRNGKVLAMIAAACLALTLVQGSRGLAEGKKYIADGSGNIVGIYRDDSSRTASYPLKVEISRDGETVSRDIIMTLNGKQGKAAGDVDEGGSLDESLADIIYEAEKDAGRRVMLPESLPDGTRISWSRDTGGRPGIFPAAGLLLMLMYYWSTRKKAREAVTSRAESISRELPAFNSQLLMLIRSGLIFSDAFMRIAAGYEKRGAEKDYFRGLIAGAGRLSRETGRSLVSVLNETAGRTGVRDFSRMVGIITDNQCRGTDFAGKLESESEILWNRRKKMAEEKGRLAETKLTGPLAVLLMVLILITAAPAILQVKGG